MGSDQPLVAELVNGRFGLFVPLCNICLPRSSTVHLNILACEQVFLSGEVQEKLTCCDRLDWQNSKFCIRGL